LTKAKGSFKLKVEMAKKRRQTKVRLSFSEFISDPMIGSAILVFALIALFLSISEFGQVLSFY